MTQYICFAVIVVVYISATLFTGHVLGKMHKPKAHISGKLVIDKTGEADRWTFVLDDDLGDVEKMDKVVLRIEKIE